jgi:hypothetical protein
MNKQDLQKIAAETSTDLAAEALEIEEKKMRKSKVDSIARAISKDALEEQSSPEVTPSIEVPFAKQKTLRVRLDQVETDPMNFRHEVDYHDKQLQNSILTTGGLLKAPIVTPSGEKTDDGRAKYVIVGGNRSTHNLREVLKSRGVDPDTYEIDVIVREYSGEKNQKHIQKILEMVMDNESQQAMSPIDLMHAYSELERSGMGRSEIAEKFGKTPAHVSQIMKFSMLPESIQNLIHFETNKERLAKVADEEFYRSNGIIFEKNADGTYEIHGVGYRNGMTMCTIFQRRPGKTAKRAEVAHWEQQVIDVQDFLLREEILKAAQNMSGTSFEDFLRRKAADAGLIEVENAEREERFVKAGRKSKQDVQVDSVEVPVKLGESSEVSEVSEASEVSEVSEATATEQVEENKAPKFVAHVEKSAPVSRAASEPKSQVPVSSNLSTNNYADMLAEGRIELSVDWADKLAERVKMGDHFAERLVKWMVLNDFLVEV